MPGMRRQREPVKLIPKVLGVSLCITLALPAAVLAARGIVDAPTGPHGARHALSNAHTAFDLPARFAQYHTPSANRAMRGYYMHRVPSGQPPLLCTVVIAAVAHLQSSKPHVANAAGFWGGDSFTITRRGRVDALRWYVGRSGPQFIAFGWRPAPRGIAAPRLRYATFNMMLGVDVQGTDDVCAARVAREQPTLRSAIRSVRIVSTS